MNLQEKLSAQFDVWFAEVQALTDEALESSEEWASFWFDGHTPEEALEDYKSGAMQTPTVRGDYHDGERG